MTPGEREAPFPLAAGQRAVEDASVGLKEKHQRAAHPQATQEDKGASISAQQDAKPGQAGRRRPRWLPLLGVRRLRDEVQERRWRRRTSAR